MSGIDLLMDTNAVIYYMGGNACMKEFLHARFALSIISRIKLLSWRGLTREDEQKIVSLLGRCVVFNITSEIERVTIEIRKECNIKLPDSIIAATAMCYGLPLLSADTVFLRVRGLDFVQLLPTK